jgi:predicted PhzF superfamily epimerase YddE/YHI9
MSIRVVQVDAFTDRPFAGNPAAVCVLSEAASEQWMRDVAREMNLSETSFLVPEDGGFRLRWFTPSVEVALCGHATVAAAHVLWQDRHLPPGAQARFHTRSGLLFADRRGEWIELDFPAKLAVAAEEPPGMFAALGVSTPMVMRNQFDYLLELESEAAVRSISPDFTALRKIDARGVIVTARTSKAGFDFVSRFFAPAVGVDEDPVTGSAHCALAPYWGERLGKTEMTGYQASARGGVVRVRLGGDRVILGGQAVTVMAGDLVV